MNLLESELEGLKLRLKLKDAHNQNVKIHIFNQGYEYTESIKQGEKQLDIILPDEGATYYIKTDDKTVIVKQKSITTEKQEIPLNISDYKVSNNSIIINGENISDKIIELRWKSNNKLKLEDGHELINPGRFNLSIKIHSIISNLSYDITDNIGNKYTLDIRKPTIVTKIKENKTIRLENNNRVILPIRYHESIIRIPYENFIISGDNNFDNMKLGKINENTLSIKREDVVFSWGELKNEIKLYSEDKNKEIVVEDILTPYKETIKKPILYLEHDNMNVSRKVKYMPLEFLFDKKITESFWIRMLINEKEKIYKLNPDNKRILVKIDSLANSIKIIDKSNNIEIKNNNYPTAELNKVLSGIETLDIINKSVDLNKVRLNGTTLKYNDFDFYGIMNRINGKVNRREDIVFIQENPIYTLSIKKEQ